MIRVSACVIVRNEEKNIGRWLENMKQIADEWIVVDTGSEDRTIELAEHGGAVVYSFPWRNDFAAAKNYALEKARGQWILFLDADEYFSHESLSRLRPLLQRFQSRLDIVGLLCRLVNIDVDAGNRFSSAQIQLRIFRNLKKLRYEGAIHETLTMPTGKKLELVRDLTIYHTGYSASLIKKKLRRNLHMLEERTQKNGGKCSQMDERYFMDCWYGLGEYEKAEKAARTMLGYEEGCADFRSRAYETLLSIYIDHGRDEQETKHLIKQALQECPQRLDFILMNGLYLYKLGEYLPAECYLRQGMAQLDRREICTDGVIDNTERLLPYAEWTLGDLERKKRHPEKAQEHFLRGLQYDPHHRDILLSFLRGLMDLGIAAADQIQLLNGIYGKEKEAAFLADALIVCGDDEVAAYYSRLAGRTIALTDAYIAVGRFDAAAEAASKALDHCYRLGVWAADGGKLEMAAAMDVLLPVNYRRAWQQPEKDKEAEKLASAIHRMEAELAREGN